MNADQVATLKLRATIKFRPAEKNINSVAGLATVTPGIMLRREACVRVAAVRSGLPETHAECAPMTAADVNRRRQVLHQDEIAAAHIAPVSLQQERLGVRSHLAHRA